MKSPEGLLSRAQGLGMRFELPAARAEENVMPALVEGAAAKCTLGEMVQALADVYGRYTGGPEW